MSTKHPFTGGQTSPLQLKAIQIGESEHLRKPLGSSIGVFLLAAVLGKIRKLDF